MDPPVLRAAIIVFLRVDTIYVPGMLQLQTRSRKGASGRLYFHTAEVSAPPAPLTTCHSCHGWPLRLCVSLMG